MTARRACELPAGSSPPNTHLSICCARVEYLCVYLQPRGTGNPSPTIEPLRSAQQIGIGSVKSCWTPRPPCLKGAVSEADWGIVTAVRFRRNAGVFATLYRKIPPSRLTATHLPLGKGGMGALLNPTNKHPFIGLFVRVSLS